MKRTNLRLDKLRTGILSLLSVTILVFLITDSAKAQTIDPRRGFGVGVGAMGTDMWTQAMSGLRLFTPHRDDCNATTEVFVKIYNNSNNVDFGFCIDKDEHSAGAVQWEDARKECLDDGKRLPEVGEWKYVCDSVAGLNNMTDDWEWAGNFHFLGWKTNSNYHQNIGAFIMGNNNCKSGTLSAIARSDAVSATNVFRCVR